MVHFHGQSVFGRNQGMTTVELLIAILILSPIFVSTMYVFIKCSRLAEFSRHASMAMISCRDKLTEIENTDFSQILSQYQGSTFNLSGLEGKGTVLIDDTTAGQLDITVSFAWKEKDGRVIGEDADLDGQIDVGEDLNGNGLLDSPVMLSTRVYD